MYIGETALLRLRSKASDNPPPYCSSHFSLPPSLPPTLSYFLFLPPTLLYTCTFSVPFSLPLFSSLPPAITLSSHLLSPSGTPQFIRRKHSTIPTTPRPPSGRRTSGADLSLRRTPSPKRKVSAPSIPPHHSGPLKRGPGDPLRVVIREETVPFPSRTSTSSSIPSPIPESPLTPSSSTPLGGKFTGPHNFPPSLIPLSSSPESTGIATPTRRAQATLFPGATSPILPRQTLPKRHSRVMVIPSVARFSQGMEPPVAGKPEQISHGEGQELLGPSHAQE